MHAMHGQRSSDFGLVLDAFHQLWQTPAGVYMPASRWHETLGLLPDRAKNLNCPSLGSMVSLNGLTEPGHDCTAGSHHVHWQRCPSCQHLSAACHPHRCSNTRKPAWQADGSCMCMQETATLARLAAWCKLAGTYLHALSHPVGVWARLVVCHGHGDDLNPQTQAGNQAQVLGVFPSLCAMCTSLGRRQVLRHAESA